MWEVGIILVVALIILGPRQLVEVARTVGKLYREIQRLTWDIRNSIDLDQPLPSPKEEVSAAPKSEPHHPEDDDMETVMEQDKQSGPDFYADLLEASREEDEKPKEPLSEPAQPPEAVSSGKEEAPAEQGEHKDLERT